MKYIIKSIFILVCINSHAQINTCASRIIKLNFHFIQDDNGNNNFSAIGDGFGRSYNGYQVASDLVDELNYKTDRNIQLAIPPNNAIAINPKNVNYVLNRVYFVRDSRFLHYSDTITSGSAHFVGETYNLGSDFTAANGFSAINDSVIHIIVQDLSVSGQWDPINTEWINLTYSWGGGGQATLSGNIMKCYFYGYYRYLHNNNEMNWRIPQFIDDEARTLEHELYHSFGLNHTVHVATGGLCPVASLTCGDNIPDTETPSANFMVNTLNAPYHPGERRDSVLNIHSQTWQSNNVMDYKSARIKALGPTQITNSHVNIDARPNITISSAKNIDRNICALSDADIVSIYAKKATINQNCPTNNLVSIPTNLVKKIYFSEMFEVNGNFEVNGSFEVLSVCP